MTTLSLSPRAGAQDLRIWEAGWEEVASGNFDAKGHYDVSIMRNGGRWAMTVGEVSGTEAREISESFAKALIAEFSSQFESVLG